MTDKIEVGTPLKTTYITYFHLFIFMFNFSKGIRFVMVFSSKIKIHTNAGVFELTEVLIHKMMYLLYIYYNIITTAICNIGVSVCSLFHKL